MPKEVSSMSHGDKVFFANLSSKNLVFAKTKKVTVNYVSRWANMYKHLDLPVPEDAKPVSDFQKTVDWYLSQEPRKVEILRRLIGGWLRHWKK